MGGNPRPVVDGAAAGSQHGGQRKTRGDQQRLRRWRRTRISRQSTADRDGVASVDPPCRSVLRSTSTLRFRLAGGATLEFGFAALAIPRFRAPAALRRLLARRADTSREQMRYLHATAKSCGRWQHVARCDAGTAVDVIGRSRTSAIASAEENWSTRPSRRHGLGNDVRSSRIGSDPRPKKSLALCARPRRSSLQRHVRHRRRRSALPLGRTCTAVEGWYAYRFGGDEFRRCTHRPRRAVGRPRARRLPSTVRDSRLTPVDRSCSSEATRPEEAVRVADRRMYGGRASAERLPDARPLTCCEGDCRATCQGGHLSDLTKSARRGHSSLGSRTGPLLQAAARTAESGDP